MDSETVAHKTDSAKAARVHAERELLRAQADEDRAWDADDSRLKVRATERRFRAQLDLGRAARRQPVAA